MPRAQCIDHLVLVCRDVETTLAWYQRHLELEPTRVAEWRAGQAPFPSLRVDPQTIIDLIPGADGHRGHLDHICVVVTADDIEAVRASGELEIEAEGDRFGARGVAHSIYVTDPDGLTVELRAYPAD
ncbi:MAG TPA: VOC family protein [Acidimicrobiales bacterium]